MPEKQQRKRPLWQRLPLAILYWCWWLYVYICVMVVTGALLGAFLFATLGALTHPDLDILRRIEYGLMDGFYYFGMWSGGVAIVVCFMRAHRLNERRRAAEAAAGGASANKANSATQLKIPTASQPSSR